MPFAWTRHLARLRVSADGLGLAVPTLTELREAADAVLRANDLTEARLRITVTGGVAAARLRARRRSADRVRRSRSRSSPRPDADVVIAPWTRNENGALAGLKTISYAANVRALAYAHERGAGEAIFANTQGNLCEATGSNVFVVRDGVLVTPPATAGCLLGVTRALILELAREVGIAAEERDVADRRARRQPTKRSCRRRRARCSRSPTSTDVALSTVRRRRSASGSPARSAISSPATSTREPAPAFRRLGVVARRRWAVGRRCTTSPAVTTRPSTTR